ncbi:MAG: glycosyltransferase [Planctomycetes bacterium]|nr:glycosyltransferase [Planctomycetota bacterium]
MRSEFRDRVAGHFDALAEDYDRLKRRNAYYHEELEAFVRGAVPPGRSVLELGCATGSVLASTRPARGVGIDISPRMIEVARRLHPDPALRFEVAAAEEFASDQPFDFVILNSLLDYVEDLWPVFERIHSYCTPDTRILVTSENPLWEFALRLANRGGLRIPDTRRNMVTINDVAGLMRLLDFEVYASGYRVALPKYVPLLSGVLNKVLPRLPGLRNLGWRQFLVARPLSRTVASRGYSCSVVIPCYNEEGNVQAAIRRTPTMGTRTEILIVDDGSGDRTAELARREAETDPRVRVVSYAPNRGKGYAVQQGFRAATGDVVMILDADMAVMPEELPRFFAAIDHGAAEFVNGTRMVYPMADAAMKLLNFFGNKMFGIILSLIMEQRNTDTLCGTKAFLRRDLPDIPWSDTSWGDFDLLFGASKLRLRMAELPVHYQARTAGESKMKAWKHGWKLLKVCLHGLRILP